MPHFRGLTSRVRRVHDEVVLMSSMHLREYKRFKTLSDVVILLSIFMAALLAFGNALIITFSPDLRPLAAFGVGVFSITLGVVQAVGSKLNHCGRAMQHLFVHNEMEALLSDVRLGTAEIFDKCSNVRTIDFAQTCTSRLSRILANSPALSRAVSRQLERELEPGRFVLPFAMSRSIEMAIDRIIEIQLGSPNHAAQDPLTAADDTLGEVVRVARLSAQLETLLQEREEVEQRAQSIRLQMRAPEPAVDVVRYTALERLLKLLAQQHQVLIHVWEHSRRDSRFLGHVLGLPVIVLSTAVGSVNMMMSQFDPGSIDAVCMALVAASILSGLLSSTAQFLAVSKRETQFGEAVRMATQAVREIEDVLQTDYRHDIVLVEAFTKHMAGRLDHLRSRTPIPKRSLVVRAQLQLSGAIDSTILPTLMLQPCNSSYLDYFDFLLAGEDGGVGVGGGGRAMGGRRERL